MNVFKEINGNVLKATVTGYEKFDFFNNFCIFHARNNYINSTHYRFRACGTVSTNVKKRIVGAILWD
jgi:hypothetical protein